MSANFTPPIPFDHATLDRLEAELKAHRLEHSKCAGALVALWDRIDFAGETLDDSAARRAVGRASDAVDAAYAAWRAEWARVGKPLSRAEVRP